MLEEELEERGPREPPPEPRTLTVKRSRGDRIFRMLAVAGGCSTLLIMGLIGFFLVVKAIQPLREAGWHFLTTFEWIPDGIPDQTGPLFGVGAMLAGTLISSALAVVIAVPISVGAALFISHYAPRNMRGPLTTLIDLMAAIPSLIFGLWGLYYLQPRMNGITNWLADYLGFIPIFKTTVPFYGNSLFVVGVVLGLMIIPIITSVTRAVMEQVPPANCEAALALGGTRWGMARRVILPHSRSGIIGASMLGLGRALGETIAVALILSLSFDVSPHILQPGGGSIAGLIANSFGESTEFGRDALIAAGLVLFVVTLLVNMLARWVVNRSVSSKGLDTA